MKLSSLVWVTFNSATSDIKSKYVYIYIYIYTYNFKSGDVFNNNYAQLTTYGWNF